MTATKSTNLALALTATEAGITSLINSPPQFDATQKLADMASVNRALGSFPGAPILTANTQLTAAHAGKYLLVDGNVTITLPAIGAMPPGTTFHIESSSGSTITVLAGSGQSIDGPNKAIDGTTMTLAANVSSSFTIYSATQYRAHGGSGAATKVTNGYQRLPSGIILQWGYGTTDGTGAAAITLPMAFPNACLTAIASDNSAAGANGVDIVGVGAISAATVTFYVTTHAGVPSATAAFRWLAIGY